MVETFLWIAGMVGTLCLCVLMIALTVLIIEKMFMKFIYKDY